MRIIFLLITVSLFTFSTYAQKWEAGIFLGGSNYMGDLTVGYLDLKETHTSIGAYGQYNLNEHFSFRAGFYYGTISGNDANADSPQRQLRNLSFQSRIYEAGLHTLWYPFPNKIYIRDNLLRPYFFTGVALFHFNPQAYYMGEWVDLQPLGTEGQYIGFEDRQYSLTQISIPIGAGFSYDVTDAFSVGMEVGVRKTFTDYLDDVSTTYVSNRRLLEESGPLSAALADRSGEVQPGHKYTEPDTRGNPGNDDWYVFAGVNLGFKLFTQNERQKRLNCKF
ncbi:MAG: hypothetical protein EA412_11720 [Chitinophagaceae bacterium]|nr:MAG: hypothetical protein EA412_11720 [Chitinophagaceae bacterium]